jgi:hypothetical protein
MFTTSTKWLIALAALLATAIGIASYVTVAEKNSMPTKDEASVVDSRVPAIANTSDTRAAPQPLSRNRPAQQNHVELPADRNRQAHQGGPATPGDQSVVHATPAQPGETPGRLADVLSGGHDHLHEIIAPDIGADSTILSTPEIIYPSGHGTERGTLYR